MTVQPFGILANQPTNYNELRNTAFHFQLGGEGAENINYFVVSANLPGLILGTAEQITPLGRIPWSGDGQFEELVIEFIVDSDLTNWIEIFSWIRMATTLKNREDYDKLKVHRDGFLIIKSNQLTPKVKIQFDNLVPMSLSGLDFDSRSSESTPLTASVSFAYTHYDVEVLNT